MPADYWNTTTNQTGWLQGGWYTRGTGLPPADFQKGYLGYTPDKTTWHMPGNLPEWGSDWQTQPLPGGNGFSPNPNVPPEIAPPPNDPPPAPAPTPQPSPMQIPKLSSGEVGMLAFIGWLALSGCIASKECYP